MYIIVVLHDKPNVNQLKLQQRNKRLIKFYGSYEVAFCLQKTRPFYNYVYIIFISHKKKQFRFYSRSTLDLKLKVVTENWISFENLKKQECPYHHETLEKVWFLFQFVPWTKTNLYKHWNIFKKNKKTLWPLFMDEVKLPQG